MRIEPADAAACSLILAQAAWWSSIALTGYFRLDDFYYLGETRDAELWGWLGRIFWEHFAPGHRLVFWLLGGATPANWFTLQAALVASFAVGLVFFYRALVLLFGRSWWLLVPLAITGFAWQFSIGFIWPSAGLQILPEFVCGAICLYAFLKHLQTERWGWLLAAVLAFTVALSFYVRALLIPVVLVAIRYLLLQPSLAPGELARAIWADRLRWLAFLVPTAVYVRFFWQQHAFESPPPESLRQVADYLRIAWVGNLVPGFLGVRTGADAPTLVWAPLTASGSWRVATEVAGEALVLALVALSVARKRLAALRGVAYLVLVGGATFALTAVGKVGVGGAAVGYDPRYISALCWQLPIGFVFMLHPCRTLVLGSEWPSSPRPRRAGSHRRAAAVAVAAAVGMTVVLAMDSARSRHRGWEGERAQAWVRNVRAGLAQLQATGRVPRVADGRPPGYVAELSYEDLLPLLSDDGRVGAPPNAVILPDGRVQRLRSSAGG